MRGCSCRGTAGFAHVSCLAEQAKILVAEAEENNLGDKAFNARWARWDTCSLCEQLYHGDVAFALGWACWKTYLDRPETNTARDLAMTQLGNGLSEADHHEDALVVQEAEWSMRRCVGASENDILGALGNLAMTYGNLRRFEEASSLHRDVYSGFLRIRGEEHQDTLRYANNYAMNLIELRRFAEARNLLRKIIPVARRVLGNDHELTLSLREDLCQAILDGEFAATEKCEALEMLEDTAGAMRRVLGPNHPDTLHAEQVLKFNEKKYSKSVGQLRA